MVQARRLSAYLDKDFTITHLFASDLSRAQITARSIQPKYCPLTLTTSLRERDFGSKEGTAVSKSHARRSPGWQDPESSASMSARADRFLLTYLIPTLLRAGENDTIAVVSHGIFLSILWSRLSAVLGGRVRWREAPAGGLVWSNTGFTWIRLLPPPSLASNGRASSPGDAMSGWSAVVEKLNSVQHLVGLRRTRGGVGSVQYRPGQKIVQDFFKKSEIQPDGAKTTKI
jgi:hypothetical protein